MVGAGAKRVGYEARAASTRLHGPSEVLAIRRVEEPDTADIEVAGWKGVRRWAHASTRHPRSTRVLAIRPVEGPDTAAIEVLVSKLAAEWKRSLVRQGMA